MKKFIQYVVIVFAAGFAAQGQAMDLNKAPQIQTPTQLRSASFQCTDGHCSCSGANDCVDMAKAGVCKGKMSCDENRCDCTYESSGGSKYLQ